MKRIFPTILFAGLAFALGACTNESSDTASGTLPSRETKPDSVKQPGEGYTLRATDLLHVEMFMEPDIRTDVSVSAEGDISLPLIGRVHVDGLTLKETNRLLTEKYKKYYKEPSLTLLIQRYALRQVYVDGFVGRPGAVPFPPEENMTISRALAGASGILPRGERTNVIITRTVNGKIQTIIVDMNDISSGKAPDIELKENDRVYVRDSII